VVRKIITIIGGCIALFGLSFIALADCGRLTESMTPEAILDRIKPVGTVVAEGAMPKAQAPVAQALSPTAGQDRYKSTCSICHETGVGGAPKFRNEADWKERAAAGMDTMLKIAIQGKGAMPPKGTCMQCSDAELKAAIEYMIPQKK
jgi:cytochrome c5